MSRLPCTFVMVRAVASRWRPENWGTSQIRISVKPRPPSSIGRLSQLEHYRTLRFGPLVTVSRLTSFPEMIPQPVRTIGGLPHPERMPAGGEKQARFSNWPIICPNYMQFERDAAKGYWPLTIISLTFPQAHDSNASLWLVPTK